MYYAENQTSDNPVTYKAQMLEIELLFITQNHLRSMTAMWVSLWTGNDQAKDVCHKRPSKYQPNPQSEKPSLKEKQKKLFLRLHPV